ncbi:MAG: NAD-dependent deacetylase [Verrucomicrobia bacterium RIFCSPLOWO2_12_FULL_64_8]|nr:MAG: NAD-dependent deacetylase [Verrucomicrobia bacterium RIFCSPLOWO2_12_FULL_64_8]
MAVGPEVLQQARRAITAAEAIIVTAGAGMGVDSGLPDFRGNEGFWRAYPPFANLGLSFVELANPRWFATDPARAWGFYGHRYELYRATTPHEGFQILWRWAQAKPGGGFVFTSNVDGHFQKAGFAEDRMVECHGSLQHLQCVQPCCAASWPMPPDFAFDIDETTMRARGELPRCSKCGRLARPNVLMFDDDTWDAGRTSAQQVRFNLWLRRQARGKVTVIELGAGTQVPTVRGMSAAVAAGAGVPLIRINLREAQGPSGTLSLAGGALETLRALDAAE